MIAHTNPNKSSPGDPLGICVPTYGVSEWVIRFVLKSKTIPDLN